MFIFDMIIHIFINNQYMNITFIVSGTKNIYYISFIEIQSWVTSPLSRLGHLFSPSFSIVQRYYLCCLKKGKKSWTHGEVFMIIKFQKKFQLRRGCISEKGLSLENRSWTIVGIVSLLYIIHPIVIIYSLYNEVWG